MISSVVKGLPVAVVCASLAVLAAAELPVAPTPFRTGAGVRRAVTMAPERSVAYGLFFVDAAGKCCPGDNPSWNVTFKVRQRDEGGSFIGFTSVNACSLEFRTYNVKDRRTSCDDCLSLRIRPADRPGFLQVDYAFDFAKLAAYGQPGKVPGFDCRLSTPRGTPDLAVDKTVRTVALLPKSRRQDETLRFTFPESAMKSGHVDTMGGREKICQHFVWRVDAKSGETGGSVLVDLGEARALLRKTSASYGHVDFDGTDAIHVPAKPTRNLMFNGGFEKGLAGWKMYSPCGVCLQGYAYAITNGSVRYEQIVDDAKFGRRACRFRDVVKGTPTDDFSSATLSLKTNTPYVVSCWVKTEKGAKNPFFRLALRDQLRERKDHPRPQCLDLKGKALKPMALDRPRLGPDWTRHELAFMTPDGCVEVTLGGRGCLVDGIMLEEGDTATETTDDPIVAKLVTEEPDNDLKFGDAHTAQIALTHQHGGEKMTGKLRVRIFNYYTETVYDRVFEIGETTAGVQQLEMDWSKIGQGVFIVRYDFDMSTPQTPQTPQTSQTSQTSQTFQTLHWTDYERFSVTDFLKNEHPTAFFFLQYPFFQTHGSAGPRMVEWMVSRGIGSTSWPRNDDRMSSPLKELYATGKFRSGVHTLEHDLKFRYPRKFRPGTPTLIQLATNVTEEVLAFVEREAYESGRICVPEDNLWAFGNEEEGWCPILNRKDGTNDFEAWGKLQKACYTGLRRAFDERGLVLHYAPTHGTCNFHLEWTGNRGKGGDRRWAFERMLEVGERLGIPYDYASVHLYSAIDGSVLSRHRRGQGGPTSDRGEEALALFEILRRHGLGRVPVRFEEGFNIAPFFIPDWGAYGWADTYYGTYPSLAAGQSEFTQAGAIARQYLMDLRWWPRVETSHVWQHRPVIDFGFSPWMWTKVPNTIGHLLPDPRGTIEKWFDDVMGRAFCYRQRTASGSYGVLALWTWDNAVELGCKDSPVLELPLPAEAELIDLMGNMRGRAKDFGEARDGRVRVRIPLTPAPLFVKAANVHDLEDALAD